MGSFGGYYSGEKRKKKKEEMAKKSRQISFEQPFVLPKVEIISKKKKEE